MTLAALPELSPVFSSAAAVLSAVDAIRSSALWLSRPALVFRLMAVRDLLVETVTFSSLPAVSASMACHPIIEPDASMFAIAAARVASAWACRALLALSAALDTFRVACWDSESAATSCGFADAAAAIRSGRTPPIHCASSAVLRLLTPICPAVTARVLA